MKNIPYWLLINNLRKDILDNNIYIIDNIYAYIILYKINFMISPYQFLDDLKNKIVLLKNLIINLNNNFVNLIKLIISKAKSILINNGTNDAYEFLIIFFTSILEKNNNYELIIETSKENSLDVIKSKLKLISNFDLYPSIFFYKVNPSLMSGYKIYYKKVSMEVSYRKAIQDFYIKINNLNEVI